MKIVNENFVLKYKNERELDRGVDYIAEEPSEEKKSQDGEESEHDYDIPEVDEEERLLEDYVVDEYDGPEKAMEDFKGVKVEENIKQSQVKEEIKLQVNDKEEDVKDLPESVEKLKQEPVEAVVSYSVRGVPTSLLHHYNNKSKAFSCIESQVRSHIHIQEQKFDVNTGIIVLSSLSVGHSCLVSGQRRLLRL